MGHRNLWWILGSFLVGAVVAIGPASRAWSPERVVPLSLTQEQAASDSEAGIVPPGSQPRDCGSEAKSSHSSKPSIQDALLQPFDFRFGEPTPLVDVVRQLSGALRSPVVLDLAALDRIGVNRDQTVELELSQVRLKTGLKLLLDQVGLTYRVVPEDNLLILTDLEGSEDPLEQIRAELRELHKDVHDLQDTLDELLERLGGGSSAEGARIRKPTIIEELEIPMESAPGDAEIDRRRSQPGPDAKPGAGAPASRTST
jgi:hypothetical protein